MLQSAFRKQHLILYSFLLVAGVMAWQQFAFIDQYASILPVRDRWHSLDPLFYNYGMWDSFSFQHGSHRLGVISWLFKLSYSLSDWNGRVDMYIQSFIYLFCSIMTLRLKWLLTEELSWWDISIPLIFLSLQSAQTLTINPYVHGLIPLFALALALTAFIRTNWIRGLVGGILGFLALFSGFAMVVGIAYLIINLVMSFRRSGMWRLVAVGLPLAGLIYMIATQNQVESASVVPSFTHSLEYLVLLTGNYIFLGTDGPILPVSTLLAIGMALLVFLPKSRPIPTAESLLPYISSLLILSSLSFCLLNLAGRSDLQLVNALNSRYIPAGTPLMAAVYLLGSSLNSGVLRNSCMLILSLVLIRFTWRSDVRTTPVMRESAQIEIMADCLKAGGTYENCVDITGYHLVPDAKALHLQEKMDFFRKKELNIFRQEN